MKSWRYQRTDMLSGALNNDWRHLSDCAFERLGKTRGIGANLRKRSFVAIGAGPNDSGREKFCLESGNDVEGRDSSPRDGLRDPVAKRRR